MTQAIEQTSTERDAVKWQVRERDGNVCTECGMTNEEHIAMTGRQLDVHRLVPGSAYSLDGCVTLCRPCHGPKPKRQPGVAGLHRFLRLPPEYHATLQELAKKSRRTLTAEAMIALEEYFLKQGHWPPPPPE